MYKYCTRPISRSRTSDPLAQIQFNLKSDGVNLVAPASPIECLLYLPNVQTGTGKVDPARKFKCTTDARDISVIRDI